MMSEALGPLNFTMFLTLFGEKLTGINKADICIQYTLANYARNAVCMLDDVSVDYIRS